MLVDGARTVPGARTVIIESILGGDCFFEGYSTERLDWIYVYLSSRSVWIQCDIERQTSDMRIAVKLWIMGLRNPNN